MRGEGLGMGTGVALLGMRVLLGERKGVFGVSGYGIWLLLGLLLRGWVMVIVMLYQLGWIINVVLRAAHDRPPPLP